MRLALILALAALAAPASASAALDFDTCKSWECASLRVPLDHSGGRPGSIDLHVERIGDGSGGARSTRRATRSATSRR